jgi:hypothetical protein
MQLNSLIRLFHLFVKLHFFKTTFEIYKVVETFSVVNRFRRKKHKKSWFLFHCKPSIEQNIQLFFDLKESEI